MRFYKRFGGIAQAYGLKMVDWENNDNTNDLSFSGFGASITYRINSPNDLVTLTDNEILLFTSYGHELHTDLFFDALEQFSMMAAMELAMPEPTDAA